MKNWIVFAVLLIGSMNSYASKYGPAGCGLGSVVFEGDRTWWKQVLAATTNTTGMQTIAITLGTSNCDSPTPFKVSQVQAFVEANRVALANDVARGEGETIITLAQVYGCAESQEFAQALKNDYSLIFPSADVSSQNVTQSLHSVAQNICQTVI
jgi:hypothetical protein